MNIKRIIILLTILLTITYFGYISPQFNSDFDDYRIMKYIGFFFPALGFSVWLLFTISLEMCFRLNFSIKDAVIASFSSRVLKKYRMNLKTQNKSYDWLSLLFYIDLITVILLFIAFVILQIV